MQAKGPNVSDKPVALSIVQARLVGLAHFSVGVNVQHSAVMEALVLNNRTVLYLGTKILKDNFFCTENVINILNDNLFSAKRLPPNMVLHHE